MCRPRARPALPNYEVITWIALFGPSGISIAIQDRLNRAISKALDDDSVRQQLVASGGDIRIPRSVLSEVFLSW